MYALSLSFRLVPRAGTKCYNLLEKRNHMAAKYIQRGNKNKPARLSLKRNGLSKRFPRPNTRVPLYIVTRMDYRRHILKGCCLQILPYTSISLAKHC